MNMEREGLINLKRDLNAGKLLHIIFDLDGTLYSSKSKMEFQIIPNFQDQTSKYLKIPKEDAITLIKKYRKEFVVPILGFKKYHGVDPYAFLNDVFRNIDISKLKPYNGLNIAIKKISEICNVILLTNSNKSHADRILNEIGLRSYFNDILSTERFNFIRKPNKYVYEEILRITGSDPNTILNIDDSYLNLEVANHFGLRTILVSNGIADPPKFWEMHKRIYHDPPTFVDYATHDITKSLNFLTN